MSNIGGASARAPQPEYWGAGAPPPPGSYAPAKWILIENGAQNFRS